MSGERTSMTRSSEDNVKKTTNRMMVLASVAVCLLLSGNLSAQKQHPPAPGTPRPFTLPAVTGYALPNGTEVRLVQYGSIPKVTVQLVVQTGNVDESAEEVWLADLVGDLIEQGTTRRSAQDVALAAARMGGSLDVGVGVNQATIGGDVLSEFASEMVALVGEVATSPAFPASELPRLKNDMLRQLSIARSQPQQLAVEKFRQVIYPGHGYGRMFPTEAAINGYTLEQAREFYNRNFGAARSTLYVVGRFDESAVRNAAQNAFSSWRRGSEPSRVSVTPESERAIYLIDRPGAVQSTIVMGVPVVTPADDDYLPLLVTNTLLGGYFSSRVTANIREAKGYTYSPFSQISSRLGSAYYAQQADVTTAVTGESLKEIFYEIDRLQKEPPSAEELQAVKNYLSGTFVLQNSSRGGIINQLAFLNLHGLSEDYLRTYVQRVNALTPADIQRMASQYVDAANMTIVVVGDRAAILDQISPYGRIVQ